MSVAENEATTMYGRGVMARGFAESGIDVAANSLADPLNASKRTRRSTGRTCFRRSS